jgi:FMN hydrolase / 5-amino-6-(5-phospho-D-ribitylamino)uracil phosphatase
VPLPELLAFDLMDTVVTDPFLPALARLGQGAAETLRECLDSTAWIDFELGLIEEPIFLERFFSRPLPLPGLSAAAIRDCMFEGYAFIPGMDRLLEQLRAAGRRLWVLSNYPAWEATIRHQLELDRFFEGYVISHQIGARKPDAAAYRELCRRAGVEAERCLLIDDRPANLEGARRVSMPALHFTGAAALEAELRARGLLP